VPVAVKDGHGRLVAGGMPDVTLVSFGHFVPAAVGPDDAGLVPDEAMVAHVERNLAAAPLAGFVLEG
jgi:hypothetical protein